MSLTTDQLETLFDRKLKQVSLYNQTKLNDVLCQLQALKKCCSQKGPGIGTIYISPGVGISIYGQGIESSPYVITNTGVIVEDDPIFRSHITFTIDQGDINDWNYSFSNTIADINFNSSNGDLLLTKEDTTIINTNLDGRYELLDNKQNNLDSDGTGTKYPTVDAVNVKVADLEEQILNVSGDKNFVFEQGIPSISWTIDHPLNKIPSVTVVDSAGTVVEGEVTVLTNNQVVVNFSAAFSGKAILN